MSAFDVETRSPFPLLDAFVVEDMFAHCHVRRPGQHDILADGAHIKCFRRNVDDNVVKFDGEGASVDTDRQSPLVVGI